MCLQYGASYHSLPIKDQVSASAVRRQSRDLGHKIGSSLHPTPFSTRSDPFVSDRSPKSIDRKGLGESKQKA